MPMTCSKCGFQDCSERKSSMSLSNVCCKCRSLSFRLFCRVCRSGALMSRVEEMNIADREFVTKVLGARGLKVSAGDNVKLEAILNQLNSAF